MSDQRRTVAKNIKLALKHADMSQGELARRIGVLPRQVSDWTRAVHQPSERYLREIALALGLPIHWFYVERDSDSVAQARAGAL